MEQLTLMFVPGQEEIEIRYYRGEVSGNPFAIQVVPVAPFLPKGLTTEEIVKAIRVGVRTWVEQNT